ARGADRRGEACVVRRVGLVEHGVEGDRLRAVRGQPLDELGEAASRPWPAAVTREAPLVDADDRDRVGGCARAPELEAQVERFQLEDLERPRCREAERRNGE